MSLLAPTSTHCSGILPPRARQRWNYSKRAQASHESNAESNSCRPESLPLLWRVSCPESPRLQVRALRATYQRQPLQNRMTRSGPPLIRYRYSRPGLRAPARGGHEEFRFVASWFSDVRSYEWDPSRLRGERDLAYPVAIELCTASRQRPLSGTNRAAAGHPWVSARGLTMEGGTPPRRPQVTRPTGGGLTHTGGFSNA
jgi:hypothetical protein